MDRRLFVKKSALVSAATMMLGSQALGQSVTRPGNLNVLKPERLRKGDTIGLITPASAVHRSAFEKSLANLEDLGFQVKYSENMSVRKGFLAGTDQQRLKDLHDMFEHPDVRGIICARGGYGSGRLLSGINYDLIRSNPKVLVGFSDITALLFAIHKMTGLICFHGPVGASEFSDFTRDSFKKVLLRGKSSYKVSRPKDWKELEGDVTFEETTITGGKGQGQLVGGNLSLLTSLMGTPYDIDFDNKIVFIEEIGEAPYRVDRMLTQLVNSGKLSKANGLALGIFKGCETDPDDPGFAYSTSLRELLIDRLAPLGIPTYYGLPVGHIDDNATIPTGIMGELDADSGTLTFLESGVK